MKQIKLGEGKLLDESGNLVQSGYNTYLSREYNRSDIKASSLRIKEWDYYYVGNNRYGIALTIADNSYMGLISVSVLNFIDSVSHTKSVMTLFPMGKTNLPSTSKIGNVGFKNNKVEIAFQNDGKKRQLTCKMKNFKDDLDFSCDIVLFNEPEDTMVIATPFEKKQHFYYNQKINCLQAVGKAKVGNKEYFFDDQYSYGVLDWGRGVWTYRNTWYWASLSSVLDSGVTIGFNLGYGFGDTSNATENMIFCNGKAYKTEQVTFHIPKDEKGRYDYLKPWEFTSSDKRINLTFTPILDRHDDTNLLVLKSLQHQVFGKFSGKLVLDNETITITDLVGFAERVTNWW